MNALKRAIKKPERSDKGKTAEGERSDKGRSTADGGAREAAHKADRKPISTADGGGKICCQALTAKCKACQAGETVAVFCAKLENLKICSDKHIAKHGKPERSDKVYW